MRVEQEERKQMANYLVVGQQDSRAMEENRREGHDKEVSHPLLPEAASEASEVQPNDIVELFEKKPHWYGVTVAVQIMFFAIVFLMFIIAADDVLDQRGVATIIDFQLSGRIITCEDGVPDSWKLFAVLSFAVFAFFEFYVVKQTTMGKTLIQTRKITVVIAMILSFVDRYDNFGDVAFCLTAAACGSDLGTYSLILFGLGVILAQILPSLVLLFTQRSTHMALRFNGLLLFLEIIEPSRANLKLPDRLKDQALGNISTPETASLAGSGDTARHAKELHRSAGEIARDGSVAKSPEEIAQIKSQIQELNVEELEEKSEDPNDVKNAALIAQAKWVVGAIRGFCENLGQGVLQILFVVEFWHRLTNNMRIFTITSVLAGLVVALGSPVYALIEERRQKAFYDSLPKLQEGVKFEGMLREDWDHEGFTHPGYRWFKLTFSSVQKTDLGVFVTGTVNTMEVLRECDERADDRVRSSVQRIHVSRGNGGFDASVEGEYDVSHARLTLKTTAITVRGTMQGLAPWRFDKYTFKVFRDYMKGHTEEMPEKRGRGMTLRNGSSIEVSANHSTMHAQAPLTLKRLPE